jgi:hypothetical protein
MTPEDEKKLKRAWEYHNAADTLFAARFNYSIVAQSMLLVSFVTLFVVDHHKAYHFWAEFVIAIFGIYYTGFQHLLSRSLVSKMDYLKREYLTKLDPIYEEYMAAEPSRPSGIQTRWIPLGAVVVWIVLLGAAIVRTAS